MSRINFLRKNMKIAIILKTYHALGRFSDLISDYDKIALTYDEYYTYGLGKGLHEYLDIITEEKRSYANARNWVELAAGTGESTRRLWTIARNFNLRSYAAVDLSSGMLKANENKMKIECPDCSSTMFFYKSSAFDYLEKRAPVSIDALFCAWGICYMNTKSIRKQLARTLGTGAYVAFIENRSDTLKDINDIFLRILRERPFMLRSVPKLNLPRCSASLARSLFPSGLQIKTLKDSSSIHTFTSASELTHYILGSSVAAGYIDAIKPKLRGSFLSEFEEIVESTGAENLPIVHKYAIATGEVG